MKRRAVASGLGGALLLALAGCATPRPPAPAASAGGSWAGRLSLTVPDQPGQSFAAAFELQGDPSTGQLALFTPLGGTAAKLDWAPDRARLATGDRQEEDRSLEALVERLTGTAIPVAALFDWLRGVPSPVPGWRADLGRLAEGRITASRSAPAPAELRIVLER